MQLVGAMGTHYHFDHIGGYVPPPFHAMLYGPFGTPPNADGHLSGLREMHDDYGVR
jgi:hypothetical protein